MEKDLIARNIAGMVEQLGEGQIRAVYMVVKELYELNNEQKYYTPQTMSGQQKTNKDEEKHKITVGVQR